MKKSDLRVKKKGKKICSPLYIYSFKNINDVCSLASKLEGLYSGDSSLYRYRETYYLTLTRSGLAPANTKAFELMLNEFGTKVNSISFFDGYLNEYGEKVIEYNALDVLKKFY
jgi:adapter protein MecA 1/2